MNTTLWRLISMAMLAAAPTSLAQTKLSGVDLEQLYPNPSQRGGLVIGGADLLPASDFRVSLTLGYQNNPLKYFEDESLRAYPIQHRWTTTVGAAYGLTPALELGLVLPVMVYQNGETVRAGNGQVVLAPIRRSVSLGTAWLQGRYGFFRETSGSPLDLALSLGIGLPSGNFDALTRDRTVAIAPRLGAGKTFGNFWRLGMDVGARIRPLSTKLAAGLGANEPDTKGTDLDLAVALSTVGDGLRGEISARVFVPMTGLQSSAEVLAGVRYPVGQYELYAVAGPGFGNAPGTPAVRAMLGMAYGGVWKNGKCADAAHHVPVECPELDLDGDGVKNAVDACPNEAAPGNGCPVVDRDEDGVADAVDGCPDEAGLATERGCPIRDSDGDGIVDAQDACPSAAGSPVHRGCPDTDADGLADAHDACPSVPGSVEDRGCPAKDQDEDGVADPSDECPLFAGDTQHHGCPEGNENVSLTGTSIRVHKPVLFATNKADIKETSHPLLRDVAKIIRDFPAIKLVVVEGHTDSVGGREKNLKLSEARAHAVRNFLIGQGIEPERLNAVGYGPDRPAMPNDTVEGRDANRRVEFKIETQ